MQREYLVVGPREVMGRKRGDKFTSKRLPNEQALVDGGHLRIVSVLKEPCEACKGKKGAPSFDNYQDLADHYAAEHPALVAPEEE